MINVLPGRHVGVVPVARRSSRLVPLPWVAAQPRALVQLVHPLHALGDGPSSHALAEHGRPASPRRARPTRRVPLRSQAVRLSLHWCATRDRARFRVRARRVARVAHAETARVRPGAEPLPCVSPRRRVADLQAVSRLCPTPRRGGASRTRKPRATAVGLGWPAEAKGEPRSSRLPYVPRHPNRPPLNPALSGRLADGCPLVPPPIFRCLLFYEKSKGKSF
jgi:hypothetical protein